MPDYKKLVEEFDALDFRDSVTFALHRECMRERLAAADSEHAQLRARIAKYEAEIELLRWRAETVCGTIERDVPILRSYFVKMLRGECDDVRTIVGDAAKEQGE
jgi:hypothetical protein